MDISKYQDGVKVAIDKTNVYINPSKEVDSGVVIYTNPESLESDTTSERLVVEGPGEYEFQGVYIKGFIKDGVLLFSISYNDREIYFTSTQGIQHVPEDEALDAVIIEVTEEFDPTKISKISYPTIYNDKSGFLSGKIQAETVKNVNLKKLTPEQENIFILQ